MRQVINIGQRARDGTGDPLRTAFDKSNQNFSELYGLAGVGPPIVQLTPMMVATIAAPTLGMVACFTDSTTKVAGAIIAGGGTNKVLAFYNGTNWTVVGS